MYNEFIVTLIVNPLYNCKQLRYFERKVFKNKVRAGIRTPDLWHAKILLYYHGYPDGVISAPVKIAYLN